mgnify:CR=1 FL=1
MSLSFIREDSSICTDSALRLAHAALPSPRFSEDRAIVLPEAADTLVAAESSELMDKPERLMLETLHRVMLLWFVFIFVWICFGRFVAEE